jgi:hypothetical protein
MKYVGQTGRLFHIRFQEHFKDYKYANNKSKFAQYLLEQNHSIGPIENVMEILFTANKGKLMNKIERFYIYKETYTNKQINDKNKNFIQTNTSRRYRQSAHTHLTTNPSFV